MDFREFLEEASKAVTIMEQLDLESDYIDLADIQKLSDEELGKLFFAKTWISGGITGCGHWGQEDSRSVAAEEAQDITPDVSKILMAVDKDSISFVVYMATIQPLVKSTAFSGREDYYGNCDHYSRSYINLKELYDVLYVSSE